MAAPDPETIEVRPDERLDLARLEPYLRRHVEGAEGPLSVRQFGGGHANLTYLIRFGEREYVLRRPPLGPVAATAHDMGREHRVLSRLWRAYDLAPRSFHLCIDADVIGADFLVMERRHGRVIRGDIPERFQGDPDLMRRISEMIIDALARLHGVDRHAVGLGDLGHPDGFVERQVAGWTRRWHAAKDADHPGMDRLAAWLAANRPESRDESLVHNDVKLDNMLVATDDPARCVAVLDWDMCTSGDPLMDMAWLLNYWAEPGDPEDWRWAAAMPTWRDGALSRAEAIALYARLTGFDVHDIAWYHVFGTFKIAVVLQQIYIRWLRGQTQDPRFADMGRRVAALIDKALTLAGQAA